MALTCLSDSHRLNYTDKKNRMVCVLCGLIRDPKGDKLRCQICNEEYFYNENQSDFTNGLQGSNHSCKVNWDNKNVIYTYEVDKEELNNLVASKNKGK